jgi:glutaredoxin 3
VSGAGDDTVPPSFADRATVQGRSGHVEGLVRHDGGVLELYQAEWCPYSHRVRQRLTELGVDFVARQVPAERAERKELAERTGSDEVPTLVSEDCALSGSDAILAWLNDFYEERPDARRHRAMARVDVPNFDEARG